MSKEHVKNINIICALCGRIYVPNCGEMKCNECQWDNGCIPNECICDDSTREIALYAENIQLKMELSNMISLVEEYILYRTEYNINQTGYLKLYIKKGE